MNAAMPLPKYHQVYLVLRERLMAAGDGAVVKPEFELMREFNVGRVTVRRALSTLVAEGLISRAPGRGTRVAVRPADGTRGQDGAERSDLLANLVNVSLSTKAQVLSLETLRGSNDVARTLRLEGDCMVQKAVRVRSTKSGPVSYITTYVPLALAKGMTRQQLARKPLLTLLEESGLTLGKAQQNVSARLADAVAAEWLGVAIGSALLSVRRVVYDTEDRPIQLLLGLYRPDRYEYQMKLSRMGGVDTRVWVDAELAANVL